MQDNHQIYMHRCLELARMGTGSVAPNPMVGAVLVYENRIIGEGYHRQYGGPHAEVNCIDSVNDEDLSLVPLATLYVSLEPCAHFGKTPPCSDLIIRKKIPKVVVGCRDSFPEVDGKGIEKLRRAGVDVICGVLEQNCLNLNRRFFTFVKAGRPYIILKWAQTADGFIAGNGGGRLLISNDYTNRLVHQWRSEEAAILVGTDTALQDDPSLTNRLWTGNSPVRMVIDRNLRLPDTLKLFDQQQRTLVINTVKSEEKKNLSYQKIPAEAATIEALLAIAFQENLQSILVEGGAGLLQSFIDKGLWDEARVITNPLLTITRGLPSPVLKEYLSVKTEKLGTDTLSIYTKIQHPASSIQHPAPGTQHPVSSIQ